MIVLVVVALHAASSLRLLGALLLLLLLRLHAHGFRTRLDLLLRAHLHFLALLDLLLLLDLYLLAVLDLALLTLLHLGILLAAHLHFLTLLHLLLLLDLHLLAVLGLALLTLLHLGILLATHLHFLALLRLLLLLDLHFLLALLEVGARCAFDRRRTILLTVVALHAVVLAAGVDGGVVVVAAQHALLAIVGRVRIDIAARRQRAAFVHLRAPVRRAGHRAAFERRVAGLLFAQHLGVVLHARAVVDRAAVVAAVVVLATGVEHARIGLSRAARARLDCRRDRARRHAVTGDDVDVRT
ncbi:MAG TPA: hypothetical protein VF497_13260, partial [Rudaea sp.]